MAEQRGTKVITEKNTPRTGVCTSEPAPMPSCLATHEDESPGATGAYGGTAAAGDRGGVRVAARLIFVQSEEQLGQGGDRSGPLPRTPLPRIHSSSKKGASCARRRAGPKGFGLRHREQRRGDDRQISVRDTYRDISRPSPQRFSCGGDAASRRAAIEAAATTRRRAVGRVEGGAATPRGAVRPRRGRGLAGPA